MPTKNALAKASESADRRLTRNQAAVQQAWQDDVREGPDYQQRHQWRAVTGWLMSEAKNVTDEERANMLAHLLKLCQEMNGWSRQVQ